MSNFAGFSRDFNNSTKGEAKKNISDFEQKPLKERIDYYMEKGDFKGADNEFKKESEKIKAGETQAQVDAKKKQEAIVISL